MERQGFLLLVLLLIAGFIVPRANSSASATDPDTNRIAMAEAEDEDGDYEDYREEAAGDIYSHSEYEEDTDQQDEQKLAIPEEEPLESDAYEGEPD